MSIASAGSAIALWGGKKGGNGVGSATPKQAAQKREAARRQALLRAAPDFVKEKWQSIVALKGRDRAKNLKKQEFTQKLFGDSANLSAQLNALQTQTLNASFRTLGPAGGPRVLQMQAFARDIRSNAGLNAALKRCVY